MKVTNKTDYDRAKAINKDLMDALNSWVKLFECHKGYEGLVENSKAAIAKSKLKEGQKKYQQPNDDPRQYGGESLPSKEDIESEEV